MTSFQLLKTIARKGQKLSITLTEESLSGTLLELVDTGVLIELGNSVRFVSAAEIVSWNIEKHPADHTASPNPVEYETKPLAINPSAEKPTESSAAPQDRKAEVPLPEEICTYLLSHGSIQQLPIDFNIPNAPVGLKKEIDRWRSKYQYAVKVKEFDRLTQDAPLIADIASLNANPKLLLLAGSFAHKSGVLPEQAERYYNLAVSKGEQNARIALAGLYAETGKWEKAGMQLLLHLTATSGDNVLETLRFLGLCVCRLNQTILSGVGKIDIFRYSEEQQNLVRKIWAYSLRGTTAYELCFSGTPTELCAHAPEEFSREFTDLALKSPATVLSSGFPQQKSPTDLRRSGKISAFFKSYGFISEAETGRTWFFPSKDATPNLIGTLKKSPGQYQVTFAAANTPGHGPYPVAKEVTCENLTLTTQVEPVATRAPLEVRLNAVPKDGSVYASAKRAEQMDDLPKAESYYKQEILSKGKYYKSAIKDLAVLYNRTDAAKAVALIDTYWSEYSPSELTPLKRLKATFCIRAKQFEVAAELFRDLMQSEINSAKRILLAKSRIQCLIMSKQFGLATEELAAELKQQPSEKIFKNLSLTLADAQRKGAEATSEPANETEIDETSFELATTLPQFSRLHLEKCTYRGVDEASKATKTFTEHTVRGVQALLEKATRKRPFERAEYLLSLAAIHEQLGDSPKVRQYMRDYFASMAEGALSARLHPDAIRCYAIEALALFHRRFGAYTFLVKLLGSIWSLLIESYSSSQDTVGLGQNTLPLEKLRLAADKLKQNPVDWGNFCSTLPYINRFAHPALTWLLGQIHPVCPDIESETTRIQRENAILSQIQVETVAVERFRRISTLLSQLPELSVFQLDTERVRTLSEIFGKAADYAGERTYHGRESGYLRLERALQDYISDCDTIPTHASALHYAVFAQDLLGLLRAHFANIRQLPPKLDLQNVLDSDYYNVSENGHIALRVRLTSEDLSAPPIEAIAISAASKNIAYSPEPLMGGQSREIEVDILPTEQQIQDKAFTVSLTVQYQDSTGVSKERIFHIPVRIGTHTFEPVQNPYSTYAGGMPVRDEKMFFGRKSLVEEIARNLSGEKAQCYVLYGQKRSGKSSILSHISGSMPPDVIWASLSALTFSETNILASFARLLRYEISEEITERLKPEDAERLREVISRVPKSQETDPVESVLGLARGIRSSGFKLIIAIDEFSDIYERAGTETFMRFWKAIIEKGVFNSLLIGQDIMPKFKQKFPNLFGVTTDRRVSYLNESEAKALASEPILLDSATRYRGEALTRLYQLTAGSPFFLQIVCNALVDHLNTKGSSFITEADIDQVQQKLIIGNLALPPDKFDCLVTAAVSEKAEEFNKGELWRLLARIASESLQSGRCSIAALKDIPNSEEMIRDLGNREVLLIQGDSVQIRVKLFSAWLRENYRLLNN